jgi:predicted dehydrogenase
MSDAVRFGLVGFGGGGRIFHAPLIASAQNIELVGVVTTNDERRAELAAQRPGVAAFDSIAALADAGVEAVTISTPVQTHAPLAKEAIARGLHVVVDKPFAMDADEAREVVDAAEEAGVLLSVYQNRRWDSDFITVRKLIADGTLGSVRRFESRFERWDPERRRPSGASGGTLLDFGSHLVDQALVLHGPASRVYAEMRGSGDLDDDFFMALHHISGVESHLWGSWRQGAPGPRFRVAGTSGTYIVNPIDGQEPVLKSGKSPADLGDRWGIESEDVWGRLYQGATSEPVPTERGRWDAFYSAFAIAVRGDARVPVDPSDAVRTMTVLDAARRSARSGEAVRL